MSLESAVGEGDGRWEEISKYVLKEFAEKTGREDITLESQLKNSGLDSLAYLEMILDAGDRYDITITDEAAEKFKTVRDIVNHIHEIKYPPQ